VKVEANLRAASISPSFFNVILSGDDVKYKKPEPDIFLMAAQRMDMPPNRCIVLEDAVNGIKAAKAAGMKALGVLTSFLPEELLAAGADAVCATIGDIWDALPSVASFSEDKS
jgi:beta-phosphoglucomutase-like phosphatase (HAD superfamily)